MIPEAIIINTIKPFVDNIVKNIINPKINSFVEYCGLKYDELLIPKGEHFQEYLYRTYKRYSIINTLVFKNEQRYLKNIYIPLSIHKTNHHKGEIERTKIEGYPSDLLEKYNKILITDTAGMGKSTLAKRIYLDIIDNGYGIPVYIELRRLSESRTILNDIKEQIDSISKEFNLDLLYRFIQTGEFIFILDGFDEVSLNNRSFVTTNIQNFISKADSNKFILTSRPEDSLSCFGDFQCFNINPLTKNEAYELLRKYDIQGDVSKMLIAELKTGKYEMINEFLKNPLLVSLLYAAFDYKQTIPLKKHIFYRQVYDAYFDSHDLSKGDGYIHQKKSGLDIDDFDRVLRHVGFKCLQKQKIEFEKDELLKITDEAKGDCADLNFGTSDLFYDLLHSVPLFCNDGQYFKWVHKSIQEYFAAQFIYKDAKENQDTIIKAIYNSDNVDRYYNLLDIYYDIDNWGFNKNITKSICENYCIFYENHINDSKIDKDLLDCRISCMYNSRETYFIKFHFDKTERKDPLTEIDDFIKSKSLENKYSLWINRDHFIILYDNPKIRLLELLFRKSQKLFIDKSEKINGLVLEENKFYKIETNSFEEDKNVYEIVNSILMNVGNFTGLNYDACKNELNKINSIIHKKEKSTSLTDGL